MSDTLFQYAEDRTMSGQITTLFEQADRARRENRLPDSHRDVTEALALCRQSQDENNLAQALKRLGQIERDLGNGDAARPLYEEAVAIYRKAGDPLALAHTIRHLGDIHHDAGRANLAEPCFHEALTIYRSHDQTSPLDLANAIRPLAILKQDAGAIEEARHLWQEAKDLYSKANVQQGVAESTTRLARLTNQQK